MKRIFLYGIAGAEDNYRVASYMYIDCEKEEVTIRKLVINATWLKIKNQSIKYVYAIDSSASLAHSYRETVHSNTIENNVLFKSMLEELGLKII